MSNLADATRQSPGERFCETAAILAAGVLRLRQRAAVPAEKNLEISAKRPPEGLELSEKTRLSVRVGYGLASGRDLEEACRLANVAAGLQIERLGITPIGWQQIRRASRPGKTIALDFDGTFTADPELWQGFVRDALRAGHRVVVVSCRTENTENRRTIRQQLGEIGRKVPIVLTSHRPKRMCAQLEGYDVDVWIDDQPGVIDAADVGEVARIETR